MRNHWTIAAVVWLGVAALGITAGAQTNITGAAATLDRFGRVVVPTESPTTADSVNPATVSVRPLRPERNALPPEVLERLERFKRDAKRYLDQQEAIRKQIVGATDQERVRLRQQLETLREQWLQRARELRMEFKDRQAELMDKLPGHREVIENARQSARERAKEQVQDVRERRGQD